jgi:hypothetical protein
VSLLTELQKTARGLLTNTTDFAVAVTLRDPQYRTLQTSGIAQDIGLSIDPETGTQVLGRRASVAIPTQDLLEAGWSIPEGEPREDEKPWLVTWTPPAGAAQTMRVVGAQPDKLGVTVLLLEAWRQL